MNPAVGSSPCASMEVPTKFGQVYGELIVKCNTIIMELMERVNVTNVSKLEESKGAFISWRMELKQKKDKDKKVYFSLFFIYFFGVIIVLLTLSMHKTPLTCWSLVTPAFD